MKERHPIAFERPKLNGTEQRYTVQEKEMTAVVHYLRVWRHYLLGVQFLVLTDNVATSYFQTQKKVSPKQAGGKTSWRSLIILWNISWEKPIWLRRP